MKIKKKLFLLEDFFYMNIIIKTYFYGILEWKPKSIYHPLNKNVLNSIQDIKLIAPNIKNNGKGLHVFF